MAERQATPDGERDAPIPPPGAPRWVKVFAIIGGTLFLLFVLLHLTGLRPHHGGFHDTRVPPGDAEGTARP
jgi:hypothetical protein